MRGNADRRLLQASRVNNNWWRRTRQVSEVKGAMRDELIGSSAAIRYSEPEKLVMSRSGDDCVVALTDQWYLTYGEDEWLAATRQVSRS